MHLLSICMYVQVSLCVLHRNMNVCVLASEDGKRGLGQELSLIWFLVLDPLPYKCVWRVAQPRTWSLTWRFSFGVGAISGSAQE